MPGFFITQTDNKPGSEGLLPSNTTEYGRVNRWMVEIAGFINTGKIFTKYAYSVTRPSVEYERITMHYWQSEIYWPGKTKYQPVTIKFYEPLDSIFVLTNELYHWHASRMVDRTSQIINSPSIDSGQPAWKRKIILKMLDGNGGSIYEHHLYGCWPQRIEGSEFNYSSSDFTMLTVVFSVDQVVEIPGEVKSKPYEPSFDESDVARKVDRATSNTIKLAGARALQTQEPEFPGLP